MDQFLAVYKNINNKKNQETIQIDPNALNELAPLEALIKISLKAKFESHQSALNFINQLAALTKLACESFTNLAGKMEQKARTSDERQRSRAEAETAIALNLPLISALRKRARDQACHQPRAQTGRPGGPPLPPWLEEFRTTSRGARSGTNRSTQCRLERSQRGGPFRRQARCG